MNSAPAFVEEARAPCSKIARLRLFAQQERIGMGYGSMVRSSFCRLCWSMMSLCAGPARVGCAATEDIGNDSVEAGGDIAELHLHLSLSWHSQGLRRDVTTINKSGAVLSNKPILEQRANERLTLGFGVGRS